MSSNQSPRNRSILYLLFFLSGFSGLVYQVVWTRLAFASFGIITPVLSVVISVFMLGLSLGAWAGGKWISLLVHRTGQSAAAFYALIEAAIGVSAFAVPATFHLGERLLLNFGQTNSAIYLGLSAAVLALSILPWCVCMGATFPVMMAYVRERESSPENPGAGVGGQRSDESFSYLYTANVLGATAGTLATALVLVELLGFRHTLIVAAAGNFLVAVIAFQLAARAKAAGWPARSLSTSAPASQPGAGAVLSGFSPGAIRFLLFTTGFCSMALEVVWTRAFAPVLKTQVYSFAMIVATYLAATFAGAAFYRRQLGKGRLLPPATLLGMLAVSAFLPIVLNDPRLVKSSWDWGADPRSMMIVLAAIIPFCALLGYLTPRLIDAWSAGAPSVAGRAYALNVLGCILGPLVASYILLPLLPERYVELILAAPFLAAFALARPKQPAKVGPALRSRPQASSGAEVGTALRAVRPAAAGSPFHDVWAGQSTGRAVPALWLFTGAVVLVAVLHSRTYEDHILRTEPHSLVRRDYAASVLAFGDGRDKRLLVNGIGMTSLTAITKFMVHVPLAMESRKPESALIICFGMGTSYRAALTWDIDVTTVELVPGVVQMFPYFHADARACLENPRGHIVIDDGRRFLKRTRDQYDLIVIDPPPPPEAAGSSLLYSDEFYNDAKKRLKPGGILQAWVPGGRTQVAAAVARSVRDSFPYVRCFESIEGWGVHLFASMEPIAPRDMASLIAAMPQKAQQDLIEWSDGRDLPTYLGQFMGQELPIDQVVDRDPSVKITDDDPYNEYFLLRSDVF